jgi:hypothetical protein
MNSREYNMVRRISNSVRVKSVNKDKNLLESRGIKMKFQVPNSNFQEPSLNPQSPNSKFQIPRPKPQAPKPKFQFPRTKPQSPKPKFQIPSLKPKAQIPSLKPKTCNANLGVVDCCHGFCSLLLAPWFLGLGSWGLLLGPWFLGLGSWGFVF